MSSFDTLPPLREVIANYGLAAEKSLGQHFLLDMNITRKIANLAGDLTGMTVIEIGPGPGGLTRALLETKAEKVVALEKDPRCVYALTTVVKAAEGRLELTQADALKVDLTSLAMAPRVVVANLPYNVGTPLLISWLKQLAADKMSFESLTLMFQAEVADRITAAPCNKDYGRLSIIAQALCTTKRVMTLPASAFTPPPKIDSAVVHFVPRRDHIDTVHFDILEKVTAAAFGQRRKMLRSSLKSLGGEALLEKAGILPTRRAEELSVDEFEKLALLLGEKCD